METGPLTAILQFKPTGELKDVFICASGDKGERLVRKGLLRLIRPNLLAWVARLFS